MRKPEYVFFERTFPSANMVLIKGKRPLLVDSGFGSDIEETKKLIQSTDVLPEQVSLIVNTHYHSDHVGGNNYFQRIYGTEIVAHQWEAQLINSGHPEAGAAEWLDQPIEPYTVQGLLSDFYEIQSASTLLTTIHTPGHTQGHISLYDQKAKALISGDLLHRDDIGWLNLFREGVHSLYQSIESLDKIAQLKLKIIYPGHGPVIEQPTVAIDAARARLEKWLTSPDKVAWHACKRILSFTLMIKDGLHKQELDAYLLGCGWFHDFAVHGFQVSPIDFIPVLIEEMLRSGAAKWDGDRLLATAPYHAPSTHWTPSLTKPRDWKV